MRIRILLLSVNMKAVQKRSQKTTEKILSAAEKMLNHNPYSNITIPALVKEANVSVGGFYGRFNSREELLDEIYQRYRLRRDEQIQSVIAMTRIPEALQDRLHTVASLFVNLHSNDVGVLRSLLINNWLKIDATPDEQIDIEISKHLDNLSEFLAGDNPNLKNDMTTVRKSLSYLISLSKDHIVVKPSSKEVLNTLNLSELISDIRTMTYALLTQKEQQS